MAKGFWLVLLARWSGAGGNYAVISWGNQGDRQAATVKGELSQGVKDVIINPRAFVAIKKEGRIQAWGDTRFGGDESFVSSSLSDIKNIYYTHGAFAALTRRGKVVTWGDFNRGGDSGIVYDELQGQIKEVVGNFQHFVALKYTGGVVEWGNRVAWNYTTAKNLRHVYSIHSTLGAFASITDHGRVETWGGMEWGGDSSSVAPDLKTSRITEIVSNKVAFAAKTREGTILSWGGNVHQMTSWTKKDIAFNKAEFSGGIKSNILPPTSKTQASIARTGRAFAAIKDEGDVVAWGRVSAGADLSEVAHNLTDVTWIATTFYAFAAKTGSGRIVTWGEPRRGGYLPNTTEIELSADGGVDTIYSNQFAFAAVKNGVVTCWGHPKRGGIAPPGLRDVVQIASTARAFAARTSTGRIVTWGDPAYGGDSSLLEHKLQGRVVDVQGNIYGKAFVVLVCLSPVDKSCEACPNNRYWNYSEAECMRCEGLEVPDQEAWLNSSWGRGARCTQCPGGSIPLFNRSFCKKCQNTEISSFGQCVRCPPGMRPVYNECMHCNPGKVADKGVCNDCPEGKFPDQGARCRTCQGDTHATPGDPECIPCHFLEYLPAEGGCTFNGALFSPLFLMLAVGLIYLGKNMDETFRKAVATYYVHKVGKSTKEVVTLASAWTSARKAGLKDEVQDEFERRIDVQKKKYVTLDALQQIVAEGHLSLIHGAWFAGDKDHKTPRPKFKRKQDLPKEDALWTEDDFEQQVRMIVVAAVSYCWCTPIHPDPSGEHYAIIKKAVDLRIATRGRGEVTDVALFFDYMSIAQNSVDGGQRTPKEAASFKAGLSVVNIPYGNQLVESWILNWVPDFVPFKYHQRAWPSFEKAVSSLIKDVSNLFVLTEEVVNLTDPEDLLEQCATSWARSAPCTPKRFNDMIQTKTVTNGSDIVFLIDKYTETFNEVIGKATSLWFANLSWSDFEALQLVEVFEEISKQSILTTVCLSGNFFSAHAVLSLINAALPCPSLVSMDLSNNYLEEEYNELLKDIWDQGGRNPQDLTLGDQMEADRELRLQTLRNSNASKTSKVSTWTSKSSWGTIIQVDEDYEDDMSKSLTDPDAGDVLGREGLGVGELLQLGPSYKNNDDDKGHKSRKCAVM